jgi:predicted metal-binding membrane protein
LLLVALAWAVALLAVLTGQSYLVDHHVLLGEQRLPWIAALAVFLAAWQVMTVAMMLPSSLPMIYMFIYASRQHQRPRLSQAAFLAGYALVWTGFALAAFAGDTVVHGAVDAWPWLDHHPWLIGAATLALAGSFQFSSLKERCLTQCRSPFSFFVRYYRRGLSEAWRLGVRHGAFCLGCCWALMLMMFGLGVGNLAAMAVLTGVMVVEKTIPHGQRLGKVVGAGLLIWGALMLWHPAWLPAALVRVVG